MTSVSNNSVYKNHQMSNPNNLGVVNDLYKESRLFNIKPEKNSIQKYPIAIYMEGCMTREMRGKCGSSLLRYWEGDIAAVIDSNHAFQKNVVLETLGVERNVEVVNDVAQAYRKGARTLFLGISPAGGKMRSVDLSSIKYALEIGMSVVNGLHDHITTQERFHSLSVTENQFVWDVRIPRPVKSSASAQAAQLKNIRVLTVGTDMSVGKMTSSLELYRAAKSKGLDSKFLATGQIGIMISGDGIPLDAIPVDFATASVEKMVLDNSDAEIVFVEGQGSICNPSSTAALPLIRGTQPTHLVLVHDANRKEIEISPNVKIPPLRDVIEIYNSLAKFGTPMSQSAKVSAITVNSSSMTQSEYDSYRKKVMTETGLYCCDPLRDGVAEIVNLITHGNLRNIRC